MTDDFDPSMVAWANDDNLPLLLRAIDEADEIAWDLETTGLNEHAKGARIVLLSLTIARGVEYPVTWLVPLSHKEGCWFAEWSLILRSIVERMQACPAVLIAHNGVFDCRWVYAHTSRSLADRQGWDTQVVEHLIDENSSTKLKVVVPRRFGVKGWDDFDLSSPGAAERVPLMQLGMYAARDTYWDWRLYRAQLAELSWDEENPPTNVEEAMDAGLGTLARKCIMPMYRNLTEVQQLGMQLDRSWVTDRLSGLARIESEARAELSGRYPPSEALEAAGETSFAPTSKWFRAWTEQAVEAKDLRVDAMTPKGAPQWNSTVLKRQQREGSDVAARLLELRQAMKQQEFLRSWLEKSSFAGRIHARYNVGRVATGRLSSSDPNMQQCVLGSTEVLTPSGWVRFDELQDGTPVMQASEEGAGRFVVPKVHRLPFSGQGVRWSSDWGSLWMTPDHRTLTYTRAGAPVWEKASQWIGRADLPRVIDRQIPRAITTSGGEPLNDAGLRALELAVIAQADATRSSSKTYIAKVTKARKAERLRALGGEDRQQPGRKDITVLKIDAACVAPWLDEDKNFRPEPILTLTFEDLVKFHEWVLFWDGDYTRGSSYKQAPQRERSVDVVQAAATLIGKSTTRYTHRVGGMEYPTVNFHQRRLRHASRMQVSRDYYEGSVYCVTVPSGAFVVRTEDGTPLVTGNCTKGLKPAFVPSPGYLIVEADYSQIELRAAAFIARCEPMIQAYQRGQDLHRLMAAQITGKSPEDITKQERQQAKAANFGLLYGQSPMGFLNYAEASYGVVLTPEEAQQTYDAFFRLWDGMAQWHSQTGQFVRRYGYVTSPLGRIRRLPDAQSGDPYLIGQAERQALNSPVQSFASDLMQMVAADIGGQFGNPVPGVRIVGTVHDSLVLEVPEDDWKRSTARVMRRMNNPHHLLEPLGCHFDVPLATEAQVSTRWGLGDVAVIE